MSRGQFLQLLRIRLERFFKDPMDVLALWIYMDMVSPIRQRFGDIAMDQVEDAILLYAHFISA